MPSKARSSLRAREITVSDFDAVPELLGKGIWRNNFHFFRVRSGGITMIRCYVTGVEPAYRCYATMLVAKHLRHSNVTYLNISAQPDTLPLIEVQRFTRYSSGQFLAVPFLQFASGDTFVKVMKVDDPLNTPFDECERDLLLRHAQWGCICLWCVTAERAYASVFRPRLFKRRRH